VQAPAKLIERTAMITNSPSATTTSPLVSRAGGSPAGISALSRTPLAPTDKYCVGVGDVLDIRVVDIATRESTLFTVRAGGLLEYPLVNEPINVAGLTADEVAARLRGEIKVIKDARLSVSVRDYSSHSVVVSGLVDSPGRKTLHREAMPLYTVLAEALPRAEALVATIMRNGKPEQSLALNDQKAMSTLVLPGDVIQVTGNNAAAGQFFYVGGQVVSAGEKDFRSGMTLTQGILACGGTMRDAGSIVKISRQNANGFLVATEYDLRAIKEGKSPDPLLQAGDRIEVGHGM